MLTECPDRSLLESLLAGSVDEDSAEWITTHAETCSDCERRLTELERQPATFREELVEAGFLGETEFQLLRESAHDCDLEDRSSSRQPRVGDYRLLTKIGEGGMGTVYLAAHVHLQKFVALKMLPADRLKSTDAVRRFQREMRAVGRLDHPHVVSASDAGEADGVHYLVMEYVVGADLGRVTRTTERLSVGAACEAVRQAALGLAHAHAHGIVHRDVKPGNLLLHVDGIVKVLDLGLAVLRSAEEPSSETAVTDGELTAVGQVMGTLDYISPEQLADARSVDHRADLYALGATLYRLLAGTTPHHDDGRSEHEKVRAILYEQPLPLSEARDDVPPELSEFVQELLSKERDDRPDSAETVADRLREFASADELHILAERERARIAVEPIVWGLSEPPTSASIDFPVTESFPSGAASSRRRTWMIALVLIGAGLMGAWLAGGFPAGARPVPRGRIEVRVPDQVDASRMSVVVSDEGGPKAVVDARSRWTTRVAPGLYDLTLVGASDGATLSRTRVEITDNRLVSSVVLIVAPPPEARPPNPDLGALADEALKSGDWLRAAELAEQAAHDEPDHGWNHGRAAMAWLLTRAAGGLESEENYDRHRQWLARRWGRTGEGTNTIPRILCLRPEPPGDLKAMLAAVRREMSRHSKDWRLPHSEMLLLYRLGRYEDARAAYERSRAVARNGKLLNAIDLVWLSMIERKLGDRERAEQHLESALESARNLEIGKGLVGNWFDYAEFLTLLWNAFPGQGAPAADQPGVEPLPGARLSEGIEVVYVAPREHIVSAVAIGGPQPLAAIASHDHAHLTLLDGGKEMIRVHTGGSRINALAVAPHGRFVVAGRASGAIDLVDPTSGTLQRTMASGSSVTGVDVSPDGRFVVSAHRSGRLVYWSVQRGQPESEWVLPGPGGCVRFSPEGTSVLVTTQGGRIAIWQPARDRFRIHVEDGTGDAADWLSNEKIIWAGRPGTLSVQSLSDGRIDAGTDPDHNRKTLARFADPRFVVSGDGDGSVRLLDLKTRSYCVLGTTPGRIASDIAVSGDGRFVVVGGLSTGRSGTGAAVVWRLPDELVDDAADYIRRHQEPREDREPPR